MTTHASRTTILIAEDDPSLRELYKAWLPSDYTVRSASNGQEAVERMDDTVDVLLVDRQMPGRSGDELLDIVADRGYDCRSAMITGVDPDFDILDLECVAYLKKPVSKADVRTTVSRLRRLGTYSEPLQEYFALVWKKAVLEEHKRPAALAQDSRYNEVVETIATIRERLVDESAAFATEEFHDLLVGIDAESTPLRNDQ